MVALEHSSDTSDFGAKSALTAAATRPDPRIRTLPLPRRPQGCRDPKRLQIIVWRSADQITFSILTSGTTTISRQEHPAWTGQ